MKQKFKIVKKYHKFREQYLYYIIGEDNFTYACKTTHEAAVEEAKELEKKEWH